MQQPQTRKIMQWLRERSKLIRINNKKIDEWINDYIDQCILNGKPVEILTQLCVSKVLELRYRIQGNRLVPTDGEKDSFLKEIPEIIKCFKSNEVAINWCITLNRSFLDGGRIDLAIENEYRTMIQSLIDESGVTDVVFYNWEDDILGKRPEPNNLLLEDFSKYISDSAFESQVIRHTTWLQDSAKISRTAEQIKNDVMFEIACEAEEGRFLFSKESPYPKGTFILMSFETDGKYVFFKTLEPQFTERIVSILKPNPWRLKPKD